jgi:GABA(A) receptor-associated protein
MSYKSSFPFEKRLEESTRIKNKHADRIPVVCEISKRQHDDLPKIDKSKFLVPTNLSVGHLLIVIRNRMKLSADKAIFLFVGDTIPPSTETIGAIYERFKDPDGFLYVSYSSENVFGY